MIKNLLKPQTQTKIFLVREGDIQPNGCDLRLGKIYAHKREGIFLLREKEKVSRELIEIYPNENHLYVLSTGYYLIEFLNTIEVGKDECGVVLPRSTLMRNGCMINTALYDSGYCGKMIAGLQVYAPEVQFEQHVRLAQYICFDSDAMGLYAGQYQKTDKII